jgi:hypothetical protein
MFRWPDAVERRDSIFGESSPAARDYSYQMREITPGFFIFFAQNRR